MIYTKEFHDFSNDYAPTVKAEVIATVTSSDGFNTCLEIVEILSGDLDLINQVFTIDNHAHELSIPHYYDVDEDESNSLRLRFFATLEVEEENFVPQIICNEISVADDY